MMNIQEVLTPQEIAQYQQQGYSVQDLQGSLNEVQAEQGGSQLQQSFAQTQMNIDPRTNASNSMFAGYNQENLIKWQLELDSILERVEHMLRGDKIQFNNGQIIWTPATKNSDKILNDFGVAEMKLKYSGVSGDIITFTNAFLESASGRFDVKQPSGSFEDAPENTAIVVYTDAIAGTGIGGYVTLNVYYTEI